MHLLRSHSMNAPELTHNFSPDSRSLAHAERQPVAVAMPGETDDAEPEMVKRRPGLLLLVAAVLIAGLLCIVYFGAGRPPAVTPAAAPVVSEVNQQAPLLDLPQAPGMSSASRAFSPPSLLQPAPAMSTGPVGEEVFPAESLYKVGRSLSLEWELSLVLLTNPDALTKSTAPSSFRSPVSQLALTPAAPAAEKPAANPRVATLGVNADANLVSSQVVHPGITQRTYGSPQQDIAKQVNECRNKGFIASETCRLRVCEGHWGKVSACPIEEPQILP